MLTPHKHLKLNTCVLRFSAIALEHLARYRIVSYDQLYKRLQRAVGEQDAADVRVMFGPVLSFLYLLGKVRYHPKNDSFEYLSDRRTGP